MMVMQITQDPRTENWGRRCSRQTLLRKEVFVMNIFMVVIYDEGTHKMCQASISSCKHRQSISANGKKSPFYREILHKMQALSLFRLFRVSHLPAVTKSLRTLSTCSASFPSPSDTLSSCSENKPTESTQAIFTTSERLSILEIAAGNSDIW